MEQRKSPQEVIQQLRENGIYLGAVGVHPREIGGGYKPEDVELTCGLKSSTGYDIGLVTLSYPSDLNLTTLKVEKPTLPRVSTYTLQEVLKEEMGMHSSAEFVNDNYRLDGGLHDPLRRIYPTSFKIGSGTDSLGELLAGLFSPGTNREVPWGTGYEEPSPQIVLFHRKEEAEVVKLYVHQQGGCELDIGIGQSGIFATQKRKLPVSSARGYGHLSIPVLAPQQFVVRVGDYEKQFEINPTEQEDSLAQKLVEAIEERKEKYAAGTAFMRAEKRFFRLQSGLEKVKVQDVEIITPKGRINFNAAYIQAYRNPPLFGMR